MAKIKITNPKQVINGGAKKYYFKVKGLGGPKGDQGEQGIQGIQGIQGEPGNAATVSVGTTTTLAVGQDATVENVGDMYNAVFNFGIPQGPQGPQGVKGDKGEQGEQGLQGIQGIQGEKGTNATVTVGTTTTTEPGTNAYAWNSSSNPNNAVINFNIPRGEKGETGPMPALDQTTGSSTTSAMSQKATTDALSTKQDTLTAGTNVQISNNTISATDTTYTAGNGLNLNGTEFSADTTVLATKTDLDDYYTQTDTDTLLEPKLQTEVVSQLPATGEENKLYLTPKNYTTGTATGNPITISLGEDAGQITDAKLDGDTYQQSYEGKNLAQPLDKYTYNRNGNATIESQSDGTVVFSTSASSVSSGVYIYKTNGDNANLCSELFMAGYVVSFDVMATDTCTFEFGVTGNHVTTPVSTAKQRVSVATATGAGMVFYNNSQNGATITISNIQVEAGSTASSYEPYVGGAPSPNPDYPQDIQTVTGVQTVSVNGTDYPIDLGTIELCGLGDDGNGNPLYKDRIYRDGDEWKIHKETGKFVFTAGTTPNAGQSKNGNIGFVIDANNNPLPNKHIPLIGVCSCFNTENTTETWTGINKTGMNSSGALWFQTGDSGNPDTRYIAQFFDWLAGSNATYIYALATPTDTTITDSTLIAQLEAVRNATLQASNTITNTATGDNLAGDLELSYYEYNPTNRYNKWLWLDVNNNYEQLGS